MRIDTGAAQQAYAAYRSAAGATRGVDTRVTSDPRQGSEATGSAAGSETYRSDRADISTQGRLRAQALDAVQGAPQTRTDVVANLRAQVKAGTYTVDEQRLAGHLARRVDLSA